jgi:hypothetical protein
LKKKPGSTEHHLTRDVLLLVDPHSPEKSGYGSFSGNSLGTGFPKVRSQSVMALKQKAATPAGHLKKSLSLFVNFQALK